MVAPSTIPKENYSRNKENGVVDATSELRECALAVGYLLQIIGFNLNLYPLARQHHLFFIDVTLFKKHSFVTTDWEIFAETKACGWRFVILK